MCMHERACQALTAHRHRHCTGMDSMMGKDTHTHTLCSSPQRVIGSERWRELGYQVGAGLCQRATL